MAAFERRVIHTKIAEDESLITESLGEEPNRRVVIKIKKGQQSLDQVSEDIDL
ncbi:R3H domain-containing nucleic acid-binding protein [Patescibacteria group bacterium]